MNNKLLCISNDKSFFFLCKVIFADSVDLLFAQHNWFDVFYNTIPTFRGILISDSDVSPEQMEKTIAFLQKIYKGSVFICTKKDDAPEHAAHNVIVINENFKKSLFLKMGIDPAINQPIPLQVTNTSALEKQNNYSKKTFKELLDIASSCDSPVLLIGETGAGKSFAARYIHYNSSRKAKPFTEESLANINPNLIESTLFGTIRGAFTSAEDKAGLLENAKDGTVFLDEVDKLNLMEQGKFLRLLDNWTFRRIGSTKEIICSARIIFATNADLVAMMKAGQFKEEFFYRINVLTIRIPPLRERKDEIKPLAVQFAAAHGKKLSPEALNKLENYSWPGNIREMKNCIECSSILTRNEMLSDSDIIFYPFS